MLAGFLGSAFNYISASPSSGASFSPQTQVQCSTADEGGKSTAMSPTESKRQTVQEQHHTLKESLIEPQTTTGLLNQLLLFDELLTGYIGYYSHPKTRFQCAVRNCCKVLEISGHGVPWFATCGLFLLFYWCSSNTAFLEHGINMLMVLIVDLLVVAPMKLIFKRPRPLLNIGKIPLSVSSVDSYAFPSGHTSRCVALAAYFCYMPPFNPWTHLWYIWGMLLSLSRVALGRHHVLDVWAGVVAGFVIFDIVRRSGLLFGV